MPTTFLRVQNDQMKAAASASIRSMVNSVEQEIATRCGAQNSNHVANSENAAEALRKDEKRKKAMEEAARSKRGLWGPTHSESSDEASVKHKKKTSSEDTSGTKDETVSSAGEHHRSPSEGKSGLQQIYESATAAVDSIMKTATSNSQRAVVSPLGSGFDSSPEGKGASPTSYNTFTRNSEQVFNVLLEDACSPCSNRDAALSTNETPAVDNQVLGMRGGRDGIIKNDSRIASGGSNGTPASRRRQRHLERQIMSQVKQPIPLETLTVMPGDVHDIERSISELTMRSSYGEATAKLAENRRMAYYAVGKHHKNSGRGGNRRCYFTGKLILGGTPFYAGSVQQGLRTLVVFCLPSAIGLPKGAEAMKRQGSYSTYGTTTVASKTDPGPAKSMARDGSIGVVAQPRTLRGESSLKRIGGGSFVSRSGSRATLDASMSRLSSLDDMSLSLEEDLDPNWGLDREYLLTVLPAPSQELLDEMNERYPEQFETLPIQVRSPHCWRLFVKFCFFSGLPIAEGELHYKVREEVANESYGEEIILSHEVMEAVNGESAEILRLPNQKTFRYLQKHYTQQSGKLSDKVFKRTSWELVLPEI